MYQPDKNKPFYFTLRALHLILAVPTSFDKSYLKRFYIKNIVIRSSAFICFAVLPFCHMVSSIKHDTGVDISEDISMILGGMGTVVTNTLLAFRYESWSSLYINLEKCGDIFGNKVALEKRRKVLNFYSLFYSIYTSIGLVIYGIITAQNRTDCYKLNMETSLNEICGTFLNVKLPFEVSSLGANVIFAVQFVITALSIPSGGLICFMVYEVAEVIICYYQQLKDYFEKMFDATDEEERRDKLRFCIYYHNYLLGLTKQLNRVVKYTTGHLSLICAIVFGTLGNQALKAKPLGALIFLVGYVVALFALCHAGQKLMDETLSVSDAVYNSKWYDADIKSKKSIIFILARSQEAMLLDALPLGSFNYPLFLLIVKTSYTYLTLLQQTT